MAESTVSIRVQTKGAEKLKRLDSGLKSVGKSAKDLNSSLDRRLQSAFSRTNTLAARLGDTLKTKVTNGARAASIALRKAAREAKKTDTSFGALGRTVAGLALADRARASIGAAASREDANARLSNLTQQYRRFIGIQDAATASSDKFQASQTETLRAYADLASRLGSTGVSLDDLQNIYEGLNTVLTNNRVSAQEAASAQLQLNQALGAGALQGEEFRAISEAAPQLLDAVAKSLGVQRGELKKLASEGKITRTVLIQALTDIKNEGADQLASSLSGTSGKFKAFRKAAEELAVTVGEELLPVVTPLVTEATKLLKAFGKLPGPIKTAAVGITAVATATALALPLLKGLLGLLLKINIALLANPWVAAAAGLTALGVATFNYYQEQKKLDDLIQGNVQNLDEYRTAISAKAEELKNAEDKLKKLKDAGVQNKRAIKAQEDRVRKLKAALEAIKGTYKAKIEIEEVFKGSRLDQINSRGYGRGANGLTYTVAGITYDARTGKPITPEPQLPKPPSDDDDGGSGRQSQLPQLNARLESSRKLLAIDREIAAAQLSGNKLLENDRKLRRITLETEGKIAQIMLEDIPVAEKLAKIALAEVAADKQRLDLVTATAQAEKDRKAAIESIAKSLEDENALLRAKLVGLGEEEERRQRIAQLVKDGLDPARATQLTDENIALTKQLEQVEALKELYGQVGDIITNSIVSAIEQSIEGTADLQKILSDTLKQIGSLLLNAGVRSITGGLFPGSGGIPGRADGGFASGPTLVGERGPEIIRPVDPVMVSPFDQNKDSLANSLANAAVADTGDAFGEAAQSLGTQTATMANNAAQAEMGAFSAAPIQVEARTVRVGSMDVVSQEQFIEGMQRTAKTARAQLLNDLKNKPSMRGRIGI